MDKDIRLQNGLMRHTKWYALEEWQGYKTLPREVEDLSLEGDQAAVREAYARLGRRIAALETQIGLVSLWLWVAEHHHAGVIPSITKRGLARVANVQRPTSYTFFDALVACGWIEVHQLATVGESSEESPEESYAVTMHDWEEHQPYVYGRAERVARAKAANAAKREKAAKARKRKPRKARKKAASGRSSRKESYKESSKDSPTPISTPIPDPSPNGGRDGRGAAPPPELHPSGSAAASPADWSTEDVHAVLAHTSEALGFELPPDDHRDYEPWFGALSSVVHFIQHEKGIHCPPRLVRQVAAVNQGRLKPRNPSDLYSTLREAIEAAATPAPPDPNQWPAPNWGNP